MIYRVLLSAVSGLCAAQDVFLSSGRDQAETEVGQCAVDESTDHYGGDYDSVGVSSVEECCAACSANLRCVVAVKAGGTCWLKDQDHGAAACGGCVAVHPSRGPTPPMPPTPPLPIPPSPPAPTPPPEGPANIWPAPRNYSTGSSILRVVKSAGFFRGPSSAILKQAFERYIKLCFSHNTVDEPVTGALAYLKVTVDSTDESHPQFRDDESYTLDVPAIGEARLHAKTVWGALRGLETFSQLIIFDPFTGGYTLPGAPWHVEDSPRFSHRGLMIDTSRHFLTLEAIKAMIDSLPYAKLNVLHWHMSDGQSFPMESKKRPKLWDSAFSFTERYIQADIADIVEYARMRGVRVMVEFDMPGHADSWCVGYPEACPRADCRSTLNVASNSTFELIDDLLSEMTGNRASKPGDPSPGLFKDNWIHLGGDEVGYGCWTDTPAVAAWLKQHGMTAEQAYGYFVKRAQDIALAYGHRPVHWVEVWQRFKAQISNETVVHIWSGQPAPDVAKSGFDTIVSHNNWYLDHLDTTWDEMYAEELCPLGSISEELCTERVLGGQGEMWGESVDMSDLETTVWPRLAAIAERLWSPRNYESVSNAHSRIQQFRCLLTRRGVHAPSVNSATARIPPWGNCVS